MDSCHLTHVFILSLPSVKDFIASKTIAEFWSNIGDFSQTVGKLLAENNYNSRENEEPITKGQVMPSNQRI